MKVLFTKQRITLFLMVFLPAFLIGCAATQVGLEKKDLKVQTKMSKSIFLDLDNQIEKSAFIQGFSHSMTLEKAKAIGIRAFLFKPLLIKDLGRTLQEVLHA